jgi:hypothetical protein
MSRDEDFQLGFDRSIRSLHEAKARGGAALLTALLPDGRRLADATTYDLDVLALRCRLWVKPLRKPEFADPRILLQVAWEARRYAFEQLPVVRRWSQVFVTSDGVQAFTRYRAR